MPRRFATIGWNVGLATMWLLAINMGIAWILGLVLLPTIDGENAWYSSGVVRQFFPSFAVIAFTILLCGVAVCFILWFRAQSWWRRLLFTTSCWSATFALAVYFAPGILLGSMFVPGWSMIRWFTGDLAPTEYAQGFQWQAFKKIRQGQPLKEVLSILGEPLSRVQSRQGETFLRYSRPSSDGDYWVVGVTINEQRQVLRAVLHYYVD